MTERLKSDLCCNIGEPGSSRLAIPDCLSCMRQKLRATCVVVFMRDGSSWYVSSFQGDKPEEDAEAEFTGLIRAGLPDAVAKEPHGLLLNSADHFALKLPALKEYFAQTSLIGTVVNRGDVSGVRVAWRDSREPFISAELEVLECCGSCPPGCI